MNMVVFVSIREQTSFMPGEMRMISLFPFANDYTITTGDCIAVT